MECHNIAEKILKLPEKVPNSVLLLKAKCLFRLYRKKLNLYEHIDAGQQNVKTYYSILEDVKNVIELLSEALYANYIDKEGSRYLDISMMTLIKGSNELNKVKNTRCMLCLERGCKLLKSHVYPRTLLKEFADSIEEREGGRLFTMVNVRGLSPKWEYRYASAKDVRYFMLCSKCEDLVNRGGEIDFRQLFFSKLYEKSNPSLVLEQATVKYGPWLYHFCISLFFRCIASSTGIPELANQDEVYNLFCTCREFLLRPDQASVSSLPRLYLFVNPAEVPLMYKNTCLGESLNAPGFFTIQTTDLFDGISPRPLRGQYAIAHCGIINILYKFSPAEDVSLPFEWEINLKGGVYTIPVEANRAKDIPDGIWTLFQQISKVWHSHITESLFRKRDKPPEEKRKKEVSAGDASLFPHQEAWSKSGFLADEYLYNPDIFTVMSMLPQGFEIDYKNSKVVLPSAFTILTHHTFITSDGEVITLFVGAKVSGDPNAPSPFIIFFRLVSQGAFVVGFFVKELDENRLQLELFCETALEKYPDVIQQGASDAGKFVQTYLPKAMLKKGITSLRSLVYSFVHK